MLPVVLVTLLLVAAAVLAWALARGWWTVAMWPHMRPVAQLLTFALVAEGARAGLALVLQGEPKPYVGLARAVYHVEQAIVLAWPAAIAGVALALFVPPAPAAARPRARLVTPLRLVVGVLAIALAAVASAYPWLRQERLGIAYAAWSWAACAVVLVLAVWSYRMVIWGPHHVSVLMLMAALGLSVTAYLDLEAVRRWDAPLAAYGTALALLVLYYAAQIVRYWRRR